MDTDPKARRPAAPSLRVTNVVLLTTAMLTFVSFWRAGAIVLCDMASTAYYIGGIAEHAIGRSAPWFILAVMAFSACMLAVYVESSSMFVRGGVYKVVREAMGPTLAKVSVSALIFDYVLTGPISGVSAGQYLAGLINSAFPHLRIGWQVDPDSFSVIFAIGVTIFFWRQNIKGIEESSSKSLFIIRMTSVMALVLFGWSAYTIHARGFHWPPFSLDFGADALGWLEHASWAKTIGAVGVLVGIGHSFLGMSGLESLAQVYREMESPKLKNLKRTAIFVFVFAFTLTTVSAFLASSILPDAVRPMYLDNLLGGLAMSQEGPYAARLLLQAFVVLVGAMILAGAVNTSIVGSNGVLNRVAEDGILADWFRWLHPKYGTTHRMLNLVVGLQLFTILASRGNVYLLGEAYAFGVVWSFVFMIAAVVILRFKDRSPREWMVPLNIRWNDLHIPVGVTAIFLVLLLVAVTNLCTKKVATVWGLAFSILFYALLKFSESLNVKRARWREEHREIVNILPQGNLHGVLDDIERPHRVLVAVRDENQMAPLRYVLERVDPDTTEIIVLHARRASGLRLGGELESLSPNEESLFTHIISMAEKFGKSVLPVLAASNDALYAIAQTAQTVGAAEVFLGSSKMMSVETQMEQLAMAWGAVARKGTPTANVFILRPNGARMEFTL